MNDACSSLTQVLATTDAYGNRMESTVRGLGLIASIGEETTYFVTDAKGSVTALIQDGVVTDAYRYDAYGNLIERSGNSSNPYRYNGEAYSEETGLYYQRARYMNPETGTFISMDAYSGTLGNPVSQHKYLYANANPVMYEDASGYSPFVEAVLGQGLKTILSGIRTLQTAVSLAKAGMSWIQLLGMGFIGSIGAMVDSGLGGASKFDMVMAMLRGFGIGVLGFTFMSALSYLSASVRALSALFESISSLAGGIVAARDSYEEGKYEQAAFRMLMGIFGCIMGARDYRNALRDCNVSVVVDETPNGGGGRGCVGEESGAPSGFYQDVNGRWHRPNGQFASNAEVGITSPTKVSTGSHGNSLSDPRTNYGYVLVDRNTNEILKFGETIHSTTRYSKSYLDANNANMMILEQGNKLDIHLWQHDMNEYYFYNYNEYPPLNSGGW